MECVCFESAGGISGCKINITRWASFKDIVSSCLWITIPILLTVNELVIALKHPARSKSHRSLCCCQSTCHYCTWCVCRSSASLFTTLCPDQVCNAHNNYKFRSSVYRNIVIDGSIKPGPLSNRMCCGDQWSWDSHH